jgi:hypothetical protein
MLPKIPECLCIHHVSRTIGNGHPQSYMIALAGEREHGLHSHITVTVLRLFLILKGYND